MINSTVFEASKHITVEKASELLAKSEHCVRQLMLRKKVLTHSVNGKTFLDLDSVLTYASRKKGIPSWDENIDSVKHLSFTLLSFAAQELMVQPSYIIKLIKNKTLEGYISASGEVMITKQSINKYLGRNNATTDL